MAHHKTIWLGGALVALLLSHTMALAQDHAPLGLLGVTADSATGDGEVAAADSPVTTPAPDLLRNTGLYSNFARKEINPANRRFSPQYPLWTDGAAKSRWIYLPLRTTVNTASWDRWEFPVGTKLWKEFRFGGKRIETRVIEKLEPQPVQTSWRMVTYRWNENETEARLLTAGEENAVDTGLRHDEAAVMHQIPTADDCRECHSRGGDAALGFDALQLSADRDTNAPHGEALPGGSVTLASLSRDGLLSRAWTGDQPRIPARSDDERASLGYLHGNCAHCHNSQGGAAFMDLRFQIGQTLLNQPAFRTAVNIRTRMFNRRDEEFHRITPGNTDKSCVPTRMDQRSGDQMPPLGTGAIDPAAVTLIKRWIQNWPRPETAPAPAPVAPADSASSGNDSPPEEGATTPLTSPERDDPETVPAPETENVEEAP